MSWKLSLLCVLSILLFTACNLGDTRQIPADDTLTETPLPTWTPRPTRTTEASVPTPIFSNPTPFQPPTAIVPPTITPDPTQPRLLQNGRGLTNGAAMTNGEFQVEGYCTSLNPNFSVDVDQNNWYCTNNGQRVRTLSQADFDTICERTYNEPSAYAAQINTNERPAYRWRCFGFPQS